jgi:ABC-2 type transport system permease protein
MSTATAARMPQGFKVGRARTFELVLDEISYATRELWRSRIVLVFTFVLPLAWLLIIGAMVGEQIDSASGAPVMQFVTPAAALLGIMFAAFPPVARSLAEAREQRLLKRIEGTPLPIWAYLLGRMGGALMLSLASILVMFAIGSLLYNVQIIWRTLPATVVFLAVAIASFAALGLAVGSLARTAQSAQTFAVASALAVSFLSGLFTLGSAQPDWMTSLGNLFPPVHLLNALWDQFSPALSGSGWELDHLTVIALWGVGGLLVATWGLRRETVVTRPRERAVVDEGPRAKTVELGSITATDAGRPRSLALMADQTAWSIKASRRDLGWVLFALGMPVALYTFMVALDVANGFEPYGMPFAFFFACAMIVYGIGVTAFLDVPTAVAQLRDGLVLKRLRGTPLGPSQYLTGRIVAVVLLALLTAVLVFAVGIAFFGVELSVAGVLPALAVLLLGTLTLAACGFALACVVPSARATAVVGLSLLLPLSFFSDIFVLTDSAPAWFTTVGTLFPLRHFVHALAGSLDPAGLNIDWTDIAVMVAWFAIALLFAVRRWRWEPKG